MVGIWPLTASKPQKCKKIANFLQFFANLTSGPQKGILLGRFIGGQIGLQ